MAPAKSRKRKSKKRSAAQQSQWASCSRNPTENTPQLSRKRTISVHTYQELTIAKAELRESKEIIKVIQEISILQGSELTEITNNFKTLRKQLVHVENHLDSATKQSALTYKALRSERRKYQRLKVAKLALAVQLKDLKTVRLPQAQKEAADASRRALQAMNEAVNARAAMASMLDHSNIEIAHYKQLLNDSRKKLHALQKKTLRNARTREKAIEKARIKGERKAQSWKLKAKGVYTPEARAIARLLVSAGCSQEKVGSVLRAIGETAGLNIQDHMSRRTVERAIMEGGVASRVQIGHEVSEAEGTLAHSHLIESISKLTI